MLNVISMVSLMVMTGYVILLTRRNKERLTCMAAMMIAMTAGMMSGLLLGTVLGALYEGRLLIPTVLSVLAGMAVGYCTGKPVSLMAAMDGLLAGMMGGMMGAMLGGMIINESPELMIGVMNVIFIAVMFLSVQLIKEEAGATEKKNQSVTRKKNDPELFKYVLLFIPVALVFSTMTIKESGADLSKPFSSSAASVNQAEAISAVQKNGYQEATITVGQNGYAPQEIKVKVGVPVKLHFEKNDSGGCLSYLIMKDFHIQQELKQGKTTVEMTPKQPGKYTYTCGMGMYSGTITVEN